MRHNSLHKNIIWDPVKGKRRKGKPKRTGWITFNNGLACIFYIFIVYNKHILPDATINRANGDKLPYDVGPTF